MNELVLTNSQRLRPVDTRLLRAITQTLLEEWLELPGYEIAIHLVSATRMAELNERHLGHEGSTDVITFDHSVPEMQPDPAMREEAGEATEESAEGEEGAGRLTGEIFISIQDAIDFAKVHTTTWQTEVVRYVVHGILHLMGYDDLEPEARRKMKQEEHRLVRKLCRAYPVEELAARKR